jgi:acyl-coenzyme A thioesterase PaaI-like protein
VTTTFSELLARASADGAEVALDVPADWMQGRSVFGGLQAAVALVAMRTRVPAQVPLRTLQLTFVAPIAGHVTARASVVRSGASATHVEARIHTADGALATIAIGVFGAARSSAVAVAPVQPVVAMPASPIELHYIPGVIPAFIQHFAARWARGTLPFMGSTERSYVVEVGMRDSAQRATEAHVLALADFVPPIALGFLRAPANGSTLSWMVELLADRFDHLALASWRVDADLIAARDGYTNQSVTLWGPDATAIALSRQTMLVFG